MVEEAVKETPKYKHHWIILEAKGPTSPGTCQHCKETREFKNSTDLEIAWGNPEERRKRLQDRKPARALAEEEEDDE